MKVPGMHTERAQRLWRAVRVIGMPLLTINYEVFAARDQPRCVFIRHEEADASMS